MGSIVLEPGTVVDPTLRELARRQAFGPVGDPWLDEAAEGRHPLSMRLPVPAPVLVGLVSLACVSPPEDPAGAAGRPPNVVLVFADDLGYGDLACYGHPTIRTPHIDALAARGVRLTQFYVASPVCSPSRAALLTGCYPKRVGMHEHVVFPPDDHGLHPDEVTLAEVLRARGYATGCVGKWHLGHRPGLLATDQGFDSFFGVPYSNDMAQQHRPAGNEYPYRLPLMRDAEVVEWEPDQRQLTRRYTEEAVAFVEHHADEPFFLYLPHSMPHIPLFVPPEREGTSRRGLYGDVLEEIDWSVGELVAALEREGLVEDTLFVFTSDNGPWLSFGEEGGSAGLLRDGKGTNYEGGQRVPFVASWPGHLPEGRVVEEVVTSLDLFPTVAALAGAAPDPGGRIDGADAWERLAGEPGARWRGSFLYYEAHGDLAGVRHGPWKLLLGPGELYQLEVDPSERHDLAEAHPELVQELRELALAEDRRVTEGARPVGRVAERLFDPERP